MASLRRSRTIFLLCPENYSKLCELKQTYKDILVSDSILAILMFHSIITEKIEVCNRNDSTEIIERSL